MSSLRVGDVDDRDRGPDQQDHEQRGDGLHVMGDDDGGRADAEPHRPEAEDHPAQAAGPARHRGRRRGGGGHRRRGRGRPLVGGRPLIAGRWVITVLRLPAGPGRPAEPRVDPPVDLVADPLDQALGDGRVIPRSEFRMGGHRRGDLIPLVGVHALTLCRKRLPQQGKIKHQSSERLRASPPRLPLGPPGEKGRGSVKPESVRKAIDRLFLQAVPRRSPPDRRIAGRLEG